MANSEHLKLLEKGVEFWNKGVPRNIELSDANLFEAKLSETFLSRANLSRANLRKADLSEAVLSNANLSNADLSNADLSNADLEEANLSNADLSYTNLRKADLSDAILIGASLIGASLIGANLSDASLNGGYLTYAELSNANLSNANLSNADLSEAKLGDAVLNHANLSGAILSGAFCQNSDFTRANLRFARLSKIKLDGANLTGIYLWETQRAGWSIKNVICEYAYLEENDTPTYFSQGEFERLYSDKIKVVLSFQGGISPMEIATLPALIKHLENSYPGCSLRLESINDAAGGVSVTLVVDNDSDFSPEETKQIKALLEEKGKEAVEYQKLALKEKELRLRLEGKTEGLEYAFHSAMNEIKMLKTTHIGDNIHGDKTMGDNFNQGQGIQGKEVHDIHDINFNQIGGQIEKSMDLTELAAQLKQLREVMSQDAKEPEHYIALGKVAEAEEAAKAKDSSKIAESLKAAGKWALESATKIGVSLATKAIEKSMGM